MAVCARFGVLILFTLVIFFSGAAGASIGSADGAVTTADNAATNWAVVASVALAVCLIALILYCADAKVNTGPPPPPWIHNLVLHPSLANSGFNASSGGITVEGPTCIHRHRPGHFESDGARWSEGLTSGKHIFEIYWPARMRGQSATIGVGSIDAPLHLKPKGSLVGCSKNSWGLDISRRRIVHNGEQLGQCPKAGLVPEKFYMYVDADSGCVAYGTETFYWGVQIQGINKSHYPLYVMIGTETANARIQAFYRGTGSEVTTSSDPTGRQQPTNINVTVVNNPQGAQVHRVPIYNNSSGKQTNVNVTVVTNPQGTSFGQESSGPPPYEDKGQGMAEEKEQEKSAE